MKVIELIECSICKKVPKITVSFYGLELRWRFNCCLEIDITGSGSRNEAVLYANSRIKDRI